MANDRLSQLPVEVVVSPTSEKARVSHVPVEVVVIELPPFRLSQLAVEVVMLPNLQRPSFQGVIIS